jgi:hypothetical protein
MNTYGDIVTDESRSLREGDTDGAERHGGLAARGASLGT